MATNITYYEEILKEDYAPAIAIEFKKNKPLLEKLEANSEYWDGGGRHFYVPLALLGNQGVSTIAEYGTMTAPTRTGIAAATYNTYNQVAIAQLSKRALDGAKTKDEAFQSLKEFEFDSLIEVLRQNVGRQMYGDGTGNLTVCGTTTASTTVNVVTTNYIKKNMHIDIITIADGSVLASDRTVVSVTNSTSFVISGAAVTTSSAHMIVRSGAYNQEWDGLAKIVSTTTAVGGVDPTVAGNEEWKAYVDTVGGNVSMPLVQKLYDNVEMNGGKVDLLIGSYGVFRAMGNYLEASKRIPVTSDVKLAGGMTGITWNGSPLFKDPDCPTGYLYGIDYDALQIGEVTKPGWVPAVDGNGGILQHIPRTLYYESMYVWDGNVLTRRRNRLGVIKNITEA